MASPPAPADRLYALVEAYAGLGDHRTGTPVDDATRSWLAAELEARGARVEEVRYAFDRYDARARVVVAGRAVPSLPVAYQGTGTVATDAPFVADLEMMAGLLAVDLDARMEEATRVGAPVAVLATPGPGGRLVAQNRAPVPRDGAPAVLVPGAALDALRAGPVRVELEARILEGSSANVVAHLGPDAPDPLVVTTPLTGWFACAGERGTGLAVALEVSATLAGEGVPVLFLGTTGHELEHLGVRRLLAAGPVVARAVLHCGASLAAGEVGDGGPELSPLRMAMTTAVDRTDRLEAALAPAEVAVGPGPSPWPGEGEEWRGLGSPVLSITGGFGRFHTPEDVPEAVTRPDLLVRVNGAVLAATRVLLGVPGR
ncbi:MAG: hypothetical protein M5U14_02590 [Acidimicrobiia bacterium]|nr:hypothetical protein [Acidimicrobiia bacterium]